MKHLLIFSLSILIVSTTFAKVVPSSLIGNNMVLQQSADVDLRGKATPEATVVVTPSWSTSSFTTVADASGNWNIEIPTPEGSFTPHSITISDGEPLTISNVLIGEVWLASGQSNMQMPLKGFSACYVNNGFDEIAGSREKADKIRFFTVPLSQSYTLVDSVPASWAVPSPETAQDFSAVAWYYANRLSDVLDIPVGIVNSSYGGARVESWMPREILDTYPDISLDSADIENMVFYRRPLVMYNAMFHPIKNYTFKGIIWYQGCSNVSSWDTYADRLATMVKHWRDEIGQGEIPFYAVEIAPYDYVDKTEKGLAPYLREAQWESVELIPNSSMISTNDLVDEWERTNIHPGNKATVGNRLGNLALNSTYGHKEFPAESPRYKSHHVKGNEMWVEIETPGSAISRNCDVKGFELAGEDGIYYPADSVKLNIPTNEMILSCSSVPVPVNVRYGFRDFLPGTLHSGNNLPLIPFRTDREKPATR